MLPLAGLSNHDLGQMKEIREGIDYEHDERLLSNLPVGSASMKN